MKKQILRFFAFLLLISFGILLFLIFFPRKYHVATIQSREGINYWDLPTGSRIAYTLIPGKGVKKPFPVIFLQGGPGGFITRSTIASLAPLSDDGFDIFLYDQVGSGHSSRLADIQEYTAERHKNDLEEIVRSIGAEKVILIGQSWGSILAVLFTADNPGKVENIIFTSPGPIQPVHAELAEIKPPDSLHLREPLYSNASANRTIHNLRSKVMMRLAMMFGCKLATDKEADDFQTLLNEKLGKSTVCDTSIDMHSEGGSGFYVQVMTIRSFTELQDPRPKLQKCSIPVLVMKGQCDNQKWGFTNEYLEIFPNHRFVMIPSAGHSISVEQPELYLETIRDFLAL